MAQPKAQQEPTMEEILASIRRIIDSGEETEREFSERSDPNPSGYDRDRLAGAGGSASVHNLMQPESSQTDDDLAADWAQKDPFVVSRTHGDQSSQSAAPKDESAHEETGTFSGELHASDYMAEQEVYPGSMGEVADQIRAASAGEEKTDEVSPEPSSTKEETSENQQSGLVSADAEARITSALQELSAALSQEGVRSIEEIVAEELRPLLSAWLDQNMPSIVERMVAKELERMRKPARD